MAESGRIVIVGAGIAALYAALELAPRPVLVISPEALGNGASSAWAQGGIAAAVTRGDTAAAHAHDTIAAGSGTVDRSVARMVTQSAREHILAFTTMGTPFDRAENGDYMVSREAAHSAARVVRVLGDQAGREIMNTLIRQVRAAPSVQVIEGAQAIRLESSGKENAICGVWVSSATFPSAPVLIEASAVLLAGGGSAGLYAHTTNPQRIRGEVIGLAARAGAIIADPEFVQFHPTAIDTGGDPLPLATEALRGEGAILINSNGERFMAAGHPDGELAPRDIVARAVFAQAAAGLQPMLDTRQAVGAELQDRFPSVAASCARAGIDPVSQPIPIVAAAHYHIGGIETDPVGRASLPNLWVCGEAASTGLHGANRLASNGLLEAVVFARRAAENIAQVVPGGQATPINISFRQNGKPMNAAAVADLRDTMTAHVGVRRDAKGLKTALHRLDRLARQQAGCESFINMCATATLIAVAALQRCESRGSHFRDDYPEIDPGQAQRSRITLTRALAVRDSLCQETV